jgi:SAM-dependent methyltransferase
MARQDECPLCGAPGPFERAIDIRKRWHRRCGRCQLLFVEDGFLPDPAAERDRYAKHRNGPHDAGYVAFLRQALSPALPLLAPAMRGLDYGCGHTPTLCGLLEAEGLHCENYDPFFHPGWPEGAFDYVFATEVVEHFHEPARDWGKLAGLLTPGGLLTVMTAPWEDLAHFRTWGYASDETHVCFYRPETFAWIRAAFGFDRLESGNPRVFLLRKR